MVQISLKLVATLTRCSVTVAGSNKQI